MNEISRRVRAGQSIHLGDRCAEGKHRKATCANLFNSSIFPAILFLCEIWALVKREHLLTAQRAIEKLMLGILLRDHIKNEEISNRSGMRDIAEYHQAKLQFANHVTRFTDN